MTTAQLEVNKQGHKSAKKRQKFSHTNIGTPLRPLLPRQTKQQEQESLSDWSHAS